jgi:hypothetical protein
MVITKRGKRYYGDTRSDIRQELARYAELNGYPAHHFAGAACACGAHQFLLALDEHEGAAVRTRAGCAKTQPTGNSAESMQGTSLEECGCPCGSTTFDLTVAVSCTTRVTRTLFFGPPIPTTGPLLGVPVRLRNVHVQLGRERDPSWASLAVLTQAWCHTSRRGRI